MRRSPAFAAALLLAVVSVQVHAQTLSNATRIEYSASYAAMSVTVRAMLADGSLSTPLLFTESKSPLPPVVQIFTTRTITVSPGMSLKNEVGSVVRVSAMPADTFRSPMAVSWRTYIKLIDAADGKCIATGSSNLSSYTAHAMDTVMSCIRMIDLSPYVGRRVYLEMTVMPDVTTAMIQSRRISTVDFDKVQTGNIH